MFISKKSRFLSLEGTSKNVFSYFFRSQILEPDREFWDTRYNIQRGGTLLQLSGVRRHMWPSSKQLLQVFILRRQTIRRCSCRQPYMSRSNRITPLYLWKKIFHCKSLSGRSLYKYSDWLVLYYCVKTRRKKLLSFTFCKCYLIMKWEKLWWFIFTFWLTTIQMTLAPLTAAICCKLYTLSHSSFPYVSRYRRGNKLIHVTGLTLRYEWYKVTPIDVILGA